MKKILTLLFALMLLCLTDVRAVTFKFAAGSIEDGAEKAAMEATISAALTNLHDAGTAGTMPTFAGVNIEAGARERLLKQWEVLPFVCERGVNIAKCLHDQQGYQVRGVKIIFKPKDDTYKQSVYRELTISLNKRGVITGIRPTLESHTDVKSILGNGRSVDDLTRRREILKWVEDFRCYYIERNIRSLEQIFSDDALIITGSVVKTVKNTDIGAQIKNNVKYKVQSKTEYITNLTSMFKKKKYIDVQFDKISVVRHGAQPHIYGVTLHQRWQADAYSDEGWLFLIWDFKNPAEPKIHVRTWQPDRYIEEDGIFEFNDFEGY